MSFKEFCQIGFKIIAASSAAVAVFIGIGKIIKEKKEKEEDVTENCSNDEEQGNSFNYNGTTTTVTKSKENESGLLEGIKKTQDVCGKLFTVFQSLSIVVDNLTKVFKGGDSNTSYFSSNPWYGYSQPVQMGNGQVWQRVSPFIVEAGPSGVNKYGERPYGYPM